MEYKLLWPYGSQVSKVKLVYSSKISPSERPKINCPADAAQLFRKYWNQNIMKQREEFKCIYLDRNHRVMAISEVGLGDSSSVTVQENKMFAIAHQLCASSLILCHNHPSGSLGPSEADKKCTNRFMFSANYMKFRILDHIILSPYGRYYSFVSHDLISHHGNLKYWRKSKAELAIPLYKDSLIRTAA